MEYKVLRACNIVSMYFNVPGVLDGRMIAASKTACVIVRFNTKEDMAKWKQHLEKSMVDSKNVFGHILGTQIEFFKIRYKLHL